jgi:hypothetical protein
MYNITVRRDIAGNIPQKSEALMWYRPLHGNLILIMVGRNNIPFPHFFQNGQSIMSMEENIALEPACANEICALRVPTSNAREHRNEKEQKDAIEMAHGAEEKWQIAICTIHAGTWTNQSIVEEQAGALKTSSLPVPVPVPTEENIVLEPKCDNEIYALRVPTSTTATRHSKEKEQTVVIESSTLHVTVTTCMAHGAEKERQMFCNAIHAESSAKPSIIKERADALKTSSIPVPVTVSLEENIDLEATCATETCALRVEQIDTILSSTPNECNTAIMLASKNIMRTVTTNLTPSPTTSLMTRMVTNRQPNLSTRRKPPDTGDNWLK